MPCSLGRQRIDLLACSGTRRRCRPTRRHLRHRPAIQASRHNRWTPRAGCLCRQTTNQGNRRPRSAHRPSPHRLGWRCNRSSSLQPRWRSQDTDLGCWPRRHRRCPTERRNSRFGPPLNQRRCWGTNLQHRIQNLRRHRCPRMATQRINHNPSEVPGQSS